MANKKNILVSFKPAQSEISEIKHWLFEEDKVTREGFYCNWNIINKGYSAEKITTISLDEKIVGFVL